MRSATFSLVAAMVASGALAQDSRPAMPRALPGPQGGTLICTLKDSVDVPLSLEGEIGWSAPDKDGQRYPVAQMSASDPVISGLYRLKWTKGGAELSNQNSGAQRWNEIILRATTYGAAEAAIILETSGMMGGGKTFYVGFCKANFTQTGRNFE
jgi:hypothetical protein